MVTEDHHAMSDAQRIDRLSELERVKAACAAAQARITADFVDAQAEVAEAWRRRARECADDNDFDGWRAARERARRATLVKDDGTGRRSRRRPGADLGVAGQVALARQESPSRGARHLAVALALVQRLPRTLAALEVGALNEWRAEIVVRETAVLTPEQQSAVDAELFDGLGSTGVGRLGDRELVRRVRAIAYRLDAESVLARSRGAEQQRRVSGRPAPGTMCYVTAHLPVAQGGAVHAALLPEAATARAAGDDRATGQLMADRFVERVTGQSSAAEVPVEVQVVITDRALLAGAATPAQVPGYGTAPAASARDLISQTPSAVWLRR